MISPKARDVKIVSLRPDRASPAGSQQAAPVAAAEPAPGRRLSQKQRRRGNIRGWGPAGCRTAHQGRPVQARDHPLPQALRRPRGLSPPGRLAPPTPEAAWPANRLPHHGAGLL